MQYLISRGVRGDRYLAAAWSRVVHSTQYLLPSHQPLDLLPRGHTLTATRLLQSLGYEGRVALHLRVHTQTLNPDNKRKGF